MSNGKWLFYKWWFLALLAVSALLFIVGLFNIFPFILLGLLGLITCYLAYNRLDPNHKSYGIKLNQYRFRQWWWWLIAFFSLGTMSSENNTFLLGLFFLFLAAVLLFMPPSGNRTKFR